MGAAEQRKENAWRKARGKRRTDGPWAECSATPGALRRIFCPFYASERSGATAWRTEHKRDWRAGCAERPLLDCSRMRVGAWMTFNHRDGRRGAETERPPLQFRALATWGQQRQKAVAVPRGALRSFSFGFRVKNSMLGEGERKDKFSKPRKAVLIVHEFLCKKRKKGCDPSFAPAPPTAVCLRTPWSSGC